MGIEFKKLATFGLLIGVLTSSYVIQNANMNETKILLYNTELKVV